MFFLLTVNVLAQRFNSSLPGECLEPAQKLFPAVLEKCGGQDAVSFFTYDPLKTLPSESALASYCTDSCKQAIGGIALPTCNEYQILENVPVRTVDMLNVYNQESSVVCVKDGNSLCFPQILKSLQQAGVSSTADNDSNGVALLKWSQTKDSACTKCALNFVAALNSTLPKLPSESVEGTLAFIQQVANTCGGLPKADKNSALVLSLFAMVIMLFY
jgi:hypothetical protein